jgi:hypothetical protein
MEESLEEVVDEFRDGRTLEHRKAVAEAVTRKSEVADEEPYQVNVVEPEDPRNDDRYVLEDIEWEEGSESHRYRVIQVEGGREYHLREVNSSEGYEANFEMVETGEEPMFGIGTGSDFKDLWDTLQGENDTLPMESDLEGDYGVRSDHYRED